MQWVKDLVLSLLWLGSPLWQPLAWKIPHATCVAKKKEKRKRKKINRKDAKIKDITKYKV